MSGLAIPGQRATQIIEEEARDMLAKIAGRAMNVLLDGTFPGSKELPGPERWQKYLSKTDVADVPLLEDDEYLKLYQDGLALAPVSPMWRAALSIPDLYKRMRSDFLSLRQRYTE